MESIGKLPKGHCTYNFQIGTSRKVIVGNPKPFHNSCPIPTDTGMDLWACLFAFFGVSCIFWMLVPNSSYILARFTKNALLKVRYWNISDGFCFLPQPNFKFLVFVLIYPIFHAYYRAYLSAKYRFLNVSSVHDSSLTTKHIRYKYRFILPELIDLWIVCCIRSLHYQVNKFNI